MEMIWVIAAKHINDYSIVVTFNNGETKVVDLNSYLNKPIFKPLLDKNYFKTFNLNPFTIEWENGADFAPEFLYEIGEPINS